MIYTCDDCGAKIVLSKSGRTKFDAPQDGLMEETAPGRPMMPDSLRLVVYDNLSGRVRIMSRGTRALYLNKHRCSKPERLRQ